MRLLITAGPTREPIDPVRFIGNRSSGKLGLALAQGAHDRGHDVHLLLGPVNSPIDLPAAVKITRYETTAELQGALHAAFAGCDTLVMAAAVADYTPQTIHTGKLPRQADGSLTLTLKPTPDVVASLAPLKRANQTVVAFALENPENLIERATEKMRRKKVDAIVANRLETMDADSIDPTLLTADGQTIPAGPMAKTAFADWLLDQIQTLG